MKRRVNHLLTIGLCGLLSQACGQSRDGDDNTISIAISSPATQTYVSGLVPVTVAVTGEVSRVELLVDDVVVGESAVAPFNINWDTSTVDEALYRLRAVAYGPGSAQQTSVELQVVVDRTPPTAELAGLTLPFILSGQVTLEVAGTDNAELVELRLLIDGVEQADCTVDSCQVSWDTLTVADGPAELTAVAVDGAGNVTTTVRPVVVVNDGTVASFTDGSGSGIYTIPANWSALDLHQKYHVDLPAGVTEMMAIGQWYALDWQMEVDLGTGFCPDSGVTQVEEYDVGGQIVVSYTAADHGVAEFAPEQWFLHIGTGPDFDMDGHIDDGTYFALTVVLY